MSNTDSFIEEVTEEVRRDRLFALLKRWGWIGGLAVVLIVGGASFNEWRKASERAEAQAFGDALIAAVQADDGGESLRAVPTQSDAQIAVAGLLAAADTQASEGADKADAIQTALQQVLASQDAPKIYRDLAALKSAMSLPADTSAEDRIAAFDALSAPGAPFRVIAQEQKALVFIETGQKDEAIALLRSLISEAGVTPGLQARAAELMVALGASLDQPDTDG